MIYHNLSIGRIRQAGALVVGGSLLAFAGCANVRPDVADLPSVTLAPAVVIDPTAPEIIDRARAEDHEAKIQPVDYRQAADPSEGDGAVAEAPIDEQVPLAILDLRPVVIGTSESVSATSAYGLADLQEIARRQNPSLDAARAYASKANGLRHQVGLKPNPRLGYFGQQLADRNTDQHGVFVEQEWVRGDKLQLNRDVLGYTLRAQQAEYETQQQRLMTDIEIRFYEALAAQRQRDATLEFAKVARRGVDVAVARQEAEEGSLIETLQSRTLLSEVTLAAEQAEAAYQGAWRELAALAGISPATPVTLVGDLMTSPSTPDWQQTFFDISGRSPELAVARALVCEKRALLKRQRAQPIPNVTTSLGAGYDVGTDNGMINVEISAPIPVFNRNGGNISAAYADYVQATHNLQRIEQAIQARLARAAQEFEAAQAAVSKYESEILPQAQQSLDLSEQAYQAGELDFLQVLILRRNYFESTIRYIAAAGNLAQADARVEGLVLTGGLDAPNDYTDGDGIRGASFGGQ